MLPRSDIDSIMNRPYRVTAPLANHNLFRIYTALTRVHLITIFYGRIVIIMYTLAASPRADLVPLNVQFTLLRGATKQFCRVRSSGVS